MVYRVLFDSQATPPLSVLFEVHCNADMTTTLFSWLLLLAAVSPVCAQTSATLSGTVTDSSGAVVSAADVTIKNVDTGAVRNTSADAAGRYQTPSLPVGQYEIHASKSGFAEAVRTGIKLVVG